MQRRADRFAALFFLALAAFVCQQSAAIGTGTLVRPGPGLLPFAAGAGMGLLALVLLIGTFAATRAGSAPPAADDRGGRTATVAAVSVSMFVYTIAVDWLGFVAATLIFVIVLFRIVETEPWWRSLLKGILVTAGNTLVFVGWMGMRLPEGVLPW